MANKIKYNKTGQEPNSLFKGNWAIDVSGANVGGGPSSSTGLYNGGEVPVGGYLIYSPVTVYKASNDNELMSKIRDLGGDYSSVSAAITWAATQPDIFIVDKDFDNIVTDGLVLNLDAGNLSSFNDSEPTTNLTSNNFSTSWSKPTVGGQVTISEIDGIAYHVELTKTANGGQDRLIENTYKAIDTTKNLTISFDLYKNPQNQYGITIYLRGTIVNDTTYSERPITNLGTVATVTDIGDGWYHYEYVVQPTFYTGTGNAVLFALYPDYSGRGYLEYKIKNIQTEQKQYATPFVNGTRLQNTSLYDLSGIKKPLSELRVLLGRYATYNTPFSTFFTNNCNVTLAATLNDIDLNVQYVKDNYDLVVADAYVWSVPSNLMSKLKDYVDAGINCVATGNDTRTNVFVSGYNASGQQAHSITTDSESRIGLNGQQFAYGSTDVYGGISALQNGAKPIYYRNDTGFITGYVYDSLVSGASLYFDQEGLNINNEIFNASANYVTKNIINNKGTLINGPVFDSGNGGSIVFDGVNDYGNIPDNPALRLNGNFTITLWHKAITKANTYPGPIYKGNSTTIGSGYILFYVSVGNGTMYLKRENLSFGISNAVNTNWSHITYTYDGVNVRGYLNGVHSYTSSTVSFSTNADTTALQLGRADQYGNDAIGNIQMYNKTLTSQEVLQNFNAQKTRFGL